MATKILIKESLFISDLNGLNPVKNSLFIKVNILSSIILTAGFGVECMLELSQGWKGLVSLDSVVLIIVAYQIISKLSVVIIHREKLNEIVNCIHRYFWPLDKCGKKLELEFQLIINFIRKVMIATITLTLITISTYLITPLLSTEKRMPIPTFHPRDLTKSPNYELAYIAQSFLVLKVMSPSVLAFDFTFISLITYIVFELRMINIEIETLIDYTTNENESDVLERLKVIGKHHGMVLRCVYYMKDIYSIVLLSQFLTVMFIICMGLIFIISSGFSVPIFDIIKVLGYIVIFAGLLFMYCFAGAYLTFESEEVANAAFRSKWWIKTQPELRRSIALIIQRSHKPETLSAGGMINLNLETFSNVLRSTLSFFMVVQTLFSKNQVEF